MTFLSARFPEPDLSGLVVLERGGLFADGFESGDVAVWSSAVP